MRLPRLVTLGCAIGALCSCGSGLPSSPHHAQPTAVGGADNVAQAAAEIAPVAVDTLATTFVSQLKAQQYAAQWSELSPVAQALWPSAEARTAMLQAKFGSVPITGITLGKPLLITWTPAEDPALSIPDVWQVPVTVDFADPAGLRPQGVAALYSMVSLDISAGPGQAVVLGEGPAGINAPVILPAHIPTRSVDAPMYMYHLVDHIPSITIEPNLQGWLTEMGLTTLPSAFDAQMAYARRIGATSISLQHLSDALLYGLPLPPHAFVITFDDGRLSQWTNAVPVLRQDGFTAVFFPCTGLIGAKVGPQTYMTARELQDLASSGFSVEDHTLTDAHVLWNMSKSELAVLTDRTKYALQQLTGDPVQFIAYTDPWPWPTATQGGTQEQHLFTDLASFGYLGGLLDLRVDSAVDSADELWQLPRIRVGLGLSLNSFAMWLADVEPLPAATPPAVASRAPNATPTSGPHPMSKVVVRGYVS